MSKTYEALKRAEAERRARIGELLPKHRWGEFKITPQTVVEHHRLKQNLLRFNSGRKVRTLLFCSSARGEGTSTVLSSFAATLASDGDRVLLIDANLRTSSLHTAFDQEREFGLTDLLMGRRTIQEVIKKTEVENLLLVTSGAFHPNPFALFESGSLSTQVETMKGMADWVLFDSPPIPAFNDAAALASCVDGVILVVEAEKTRWEVAESARKWIKGGNGNVLGVVLNKRRYHVPQWLYKRL